MHAAPIPNALVMPGLKGKAHAAAKAAAAGAGDQVLKITNTGKIEAMLAGFVQGASHHRRPRHGHGHGGKNKTSPGRGSSQIDRFPGT